MRVVRGLDQVPKTAKSVITIGSFDGLHLGHQKIFRRLNSLANRMGGVSMVISFDPHPRRVIYPKDKTLRLINTVDEKIKILSKFQIDYLVLIPFTVEFSQISPEEYIEKFLINTINPSHIVIGYDHQFGLNRRGDYSLLEQYRAKGYFELSKIEKQELDDIAISSTKIRVAIQAGDIETANSLLGHNYYLSGKVVEGAKLGRQINYPTANIELESEIKLIPADGIYAVEINVKSKWYKGMLYVGNKPSIKTSKADQKNIEVHIFDFDEDIYGISIEVYLKQYIHEDRKYDSLDALKTSIQKDEQIIRSYFQNLESSRLEIKKNLCIAILNYNGSTYLESFLPFMLDSSSEDIDIVVIDNNSTDDSIEILEEWFPEVKLIKLEENHGFAKGYNLGMMELDYEYVVLLNSDVKTSTGWIDPMMHLMRQDDSIACVQPKILSLEEEDKFEYAGAAGGFLDVQGYPFCRGRIFDKVEQDLEQYEESTEIFWSSGAAMLVRKSVWDNLGGFDESYFAHMEEIDFCWRIKRAGYRVMYQARSSVFHLGGGTMSYQNPRKTFLNFRNNLKTILKNEKLGKLIWLFPTRLVLDGIAGLKFLFSGKAQHTIQIIKAHFSVYGQFLSIWRKRKQFNQQIEKHRIGKSNEKGRYNRSILYAHFIKGVDKFSDLKF